MATLPRRSQGAGWYSNKARGQRSLSAGSAGVPACDGGVSVPACVPAVSVFIPVRRKIPNRAWRELIKRAWDVDPLPRPAVAMGDRGEGGCARSAAARCA